MRNRSWNVGIASALATAVAALAPFCVVPAQAQSGEPIKVGFISELSGPYSFFGTACKQGLEFAEKKIASEGGVLNRPLKFVVMDDQTNPAQAVAAARSLDVQDKVLALTGPTSSDIALAVYGYAEQNKVPFVVPVAAFAQLTKPGTKYTFRVEPDAVGWGYAAVKFIAARKPGAKIALMYNDIALARAIMAGIKYQAPKEHLSIVADILFPQGSNDATVQAAQVVAAKPDYVYLATVGAFDVTATNQLLDLGIKPEQIIHNVGQTTTGGAHVHRRLHQAGRPHPLLYGELLLQHGLHHQGGHSESRQCGSRKVPGGHVLSEHDRTDLGRTDNLRQERRAQGVHVLYAAHRRRSEELYG
jgi:branched-chain amino acid transport system substrate-binding protein